MLLSILSIYLTTISLSFIVSSTTVSNILELKREHLGEILYLEKIYLYDIANGKKRRY